MLIFSVLILAYLCTLAVSLHRTNSLLLESSRRSPNFPVDSTAGRRMKFDLFEGRFISSLSASGADDIIQGVGDIGCMIESPSGINVLPNNIQTAVFFGCFFLLFGGTAGLVTAFEAAAAATFPALDWWKSTFALLGAVFMAAGAAHFSVKDEFVNIMPPQGAWGLWYLPGSKEFHVEWTGVAEFGLGLALLGGFISNIFMPGVLSETIVPTAALGLLILTVAVTPANIYMYTHGARLPMEGPEVNLNHHQTHRI